MYTALAQVINKLSREDASWLCHAFVYCFPWIDAEAMKSYTQCLCVAPCDVMATWGGSKWLPSFNP